MGSSGECMSDKCIGRWYYNIGSPHGRMLCFDMTSSEVAVLAILMSDISQKLSLNYFFILSLVVIDSDVRYR